MQTRSSSRLARNQSSNPSASTNPNPKGRNRRRSKQRIENLDLDDLSEPVVTMVAITADNFKLKHGLLTLVQNKQFFGHDKEDPHAHVRYFNKITSTLKFPNVPNTSIKLMLFLFLLEGAARIWLEKEPPRSIFTWDDLVSKFINHDQGTHFCNDQFSSVMEKFGVTHRLSIAYHPQTSGQVEVTNRGLKHILERTVGENRASWSDKLEDALWAFRTAFKTSALKHANFDLKTAGDHRKLQLNELNELRDQAYENSLIYKERTKKLHDDKIKNRIFNVGDQVLLFNSRLKIFSGKLKSRWSGPFTNFEIYPYGTAKLIHPDGCNFKVNCHRLKHYHGGDPPPLEIPDDYPPKIEAFLCRIYLLVFKIFVTKAEGNDGVEVS
nr:reverse transcriptase domain-containing protein [Tanacetum cinerariifolium]